MIEVIASLNPDPGGFPMTEPKIDRRMLLGGVAQAGAAIATAPAAQPAPGPATAFCTRAPCPSIPRPSRACRRSC